VIYYLDSSVLLRVIFKEKEAMANFGKIAEAVSSDLLRIECLRTIDRIRIEKKLSEQEYLKRTALFFEAQRGLELIPVSREVLSRASQPFPTMLGTLDAIHLSSCLLYRERVSQDITLCTHDLALHRASSSLGIPTLGI
jgi:predicted nucleic acid-binding protein